MIESDASPLSYRSTYSGMKIGEANLHALAALVDLVDGDFLLISSEVVVLCQEEHAVALLFERSQTAQISTTTRLPCARKGIKGFQ